jgi:hypothetical protein
VRLNLKLITIKVIPKYPDAVTPASGERSLAPLPVKHAMEIWAPSGREDACVEVAARERRG